MSWKNDSVTLLHIELSTYCNAACPLCLRYYNSSTIVRPDLPQTSISLDQFKSYFTEKFLKQLKRIIYCGTMGDPLMARDCYEIVSYVNQVNPKCQQIFHTNGGIRNEDFWTKMGQLFSEPNMKLIFSIDGLADTNHIYRRNVDWDKLMFNAQTFINNGGRAEWEYLIFDHNDHQVEQARQLAKDMGFSHFVHKRPTGFETKDNLYKSREVYDDQGKLLYQIYPTRKPEYNNGKKIRINSLVDSIIFDEKYPVDLKLVEEVRQKGYFPIVKQRLENFDPNKTLDMGVYKFDLDSREIQCHSLHQVDGHEIYVNAEGQVFPCCFVGTRYDARLISYVDDQLKTAINPYKSQLDLNTQNIEQILASELFQKIFVDSWSKKTLEQGKMALCAETCSKNSWFNLLYINKDKQNG
jgi:sulfatase maturation enzyme AslB (radical SAM superfamily)